MRLYYVKQLCHAQWQPEDSISMIRVGNAWVSIERHEAFLDDKPVRIGSRAFYLLEALLAAPNRLVTKEELVRSIWPDTVVEDNNLHVHVSTLRKKLALDRHTLETVPGRGYRLNLPSTAHPERPFSQVDAPFMPMAHAPLEPSCDLSDDGGKPPVTVYVIDDEPAVRAGLVRQLRSTGITAVGYACAATFLAACQFDHPGCLLLDVRLNHGSGFDLQAELVRRQSPFPIIFMTGFGTVDMSVRAMKAGAEEFLTKPFDEDRLLACIHGAMRQAMSRFEEHQQRLSTQARFSKLTAREQDIFELLINGHSNKEIAARLGLKDVTVKVHKKHIMTKLGTRTLVELVLMSNMIGRLPRFTGPGLASPEVERQAFEERIIQIPD